MRHRNTGRKLGRLSAHRTSLFRNLATSLFLHEKIRTTEPKAKELRRIAEKLITLGKLGTLAARRRAAASVKDDIALGKLFGELAERFRARAGGYTRVVKWKNRVGDAAPMAIVELIPAEKAAEPAPEEKPKKKRVSKKKTEEAAAEA